jgi:hypothetical protein
MREEFQRLVAEPEYGGARDAIRGELDRELRVVRDGVNVARADDGGGGLDVPFDEERAGG